MRARSSQVVRRAVAAADRARAGLIETLLGLATDDSGAHACVCCVGVRARQWLTLMCRGGAGRFLAEHYKEDGMTPVPGRSIVKHRLKAMRKSR